MSEKVTTVPTNEAAERLREVYPDRPGSQWTHAAIERALAAERRATVQRCVAIIDEMLSRPFAEPRYRATRAGLKVARRAILDEEAAR